MTKIMNVFLKYLGLIVIVMGYSSLAHAFTCQVPATGQILGAGTANVYVNLTPSIGVGQNLIVDLSNSILCKNDSTNGVIVDSVTLTGGSAYGGALSAFSGTLNWNGSSFPFPLTGNSSTYQITNTSYQGLALQLYLRATGAAGGVVISSNDLIATLNMYKIATDGNPNNFVWNIYASNNVVIPTGGCDVSSRNVNVTLPDYPGTTAIPLTVHCAQNQSLSYYLTGQTLSTDPSIFLNTAASSGAQGIGVQLSNGSGIITANNHVSLGTVGPSPVSLGLNATYARTTGQLVAGNVTSLVGVTFLYQ